MSAIIEIKKDTNGKLQYTFTPSGDDKVDSLAKVAVGSMQLYAKTGGNMQALLGNLGGEMKQKMAQMIMGGLQ